MISNSSFSSVVKEELGFVPRTSLNDACEFV